MRYLWDLYPFGAAVLVFGSSWYVKNLPEYPVSVRFLIAVWVYGIGMALAGYWLRKVTEK